MEEVVGQSFVQMTKLGNKVLQPVASVQDVPLNLELVNTSVLEAKKSGLPMRFGLEGGIYSNKLNAIDGMKLGMNAVYAFSGTKWSIQSGLLYSIGNQNILFDSKGYDALFSDEFDNNTTVPNANIEDMEGTFNNGAGFSDTASVRLNYDAADFNRVSSLHRLHLPVLVNYQITQKFRVEAGLDLSYILKVNENQTWSPLPSFKRSAEADQSISNSNPVLTSGSVSNNYVGFNRLDVALQGGLAYHPIDQLGIRLRYQFGLRDIMKTDFYNAHQRALNLSAVYYFGK